jgi:hypothetical protein
MISQRRRLKKEAMRSANAMQSKSKTLLQAGWPDSPAPGVSGAEEPQRGHQHRQAPHALPGHVLQPEQLAPQMVPHAPQTRWGSEQARRSNQRAPLHPSWHKRPSAGSPIGGCTALKHRLTALSVVHSSPQPGSSRKRRKLEARKSRESESKRCR